MPSLTRVLIATATVAAALAASAAPASADTFGQLGAPIGQFGTGNDNSDLFKPRAIDTDASGRMYVLNFQDAFAGAPRRFQVKQFSAAGAFDGRVQISSGPFEDFNGLGLDPRTPPAGVRAVLWTTRNSATGTQDLIRIAVPSSGAASCATPGVCTEFPLDAPSEFDVPQSVAVAPNGDVYVVRAAAGEGDNGKTILRFGPDGAPKAWAAGSGAFNQRVADIAIADSGTVYVLDVKPTAGQPTATGLEGRVRTFTADGGALAPTVSSVTGPDPGPSEIGFVANQAPFGELDVGPGTNPNVYVQDSHGGVTSGGGGFGIAELRPSSNNSFTLGRYFAETPTPSEKPASDCRFKERPHFARSADGPAPANGQIVAAEGTAGTGGLPGTAQARILRFGEFGDRCGPRFEGPSAQLTVSPSTVVRNQPVEFDASSSTPPGPDPGDQIDQWQFDLDGNTGGANDGYELTEDVDTGGDGVVTTMFATLGARNVRVRVRTKDGRDSGIARTVDVRSRRPTAALSISPGSPKAGDQVTFDASGSSDPDPDTPVRTYRFDLDGNGSFEVAGSASRVSRSFASPGRRTVRVEVVDSNGDISGRVTRFFTVAPKPGGGTFTPPRDTTPPSVTLAGSAPSNGKTAELKVTCPASEQTCRFVFTAKTAKKVKLGSRGRKKVQRLGGGSVTLKGGETKKVKFRLSSAAKKLTKRKRSLAMSVTFKATDAAGNTAEGKKRVTLKVKKKKKKR